jgi:flagellar biosynthesis protein FlhG
VNNAQSHEEAQETIDQLQAAAERFLDRQVNVLGMLPADPHLLQAVRQQRGVLELYPQAPLSQAMHVVARQLQEKIPLQKDGFTAFWKGLRDE